MGSIFLLATLLLSDFAWGSDIYHHELREYPRGPNCEATAGEVARRFGAAAGVEIYWAGASKESATTCDLKISYLALERIKIASTVDRSGLGVFRDGTTRTLANCLADLPREIAVFKRSTGLEPWIAYCYQESSFLNDLPFVPVVEGIGNGANTLFASDTVVGVTPNEGWPGTLSGIWKTSANQGIAVASIALRPYISASDKEVTIRYYAKERLYLRSEGIAEHKDSKICEGQIDEIRLGLAKADHPPIAVYCGQYAHKQFRLGIIMLSENILGIGNLIPIEDPKQFTTLEECRTDLPGTLDFYQMKLGKKVLAGMCANSSGLFRVTVISEKKPSVGLGPLIFPNAQE